MAPPGPRGREAQGIVLAGSVFCFAFLLALFPLQSCDAWWHLANGREIAEGRGIPRTNLYSFTDPDHPVTPTHWLFGPGACCVHARPIRAQGPAVSAAESLIGVPPARQGMEGL